MNVWLYIAAAVIGVAIPLVISYVRNTTDRTNYAVAVMALVSVWPSLWFVWFGAMALAIFGRKAKDVRSKSLMVLAIVGLCLVLLAPAAHAQMYSRTHNYVQKNTSGLTMFRMTLRADWDGNRSTDQFSNVSWTKSYGNGIYRFDHWVSTIDTNGRYSYGTRWRMRRITAEFKTCVIWNVTGCTYLTGYVWMKIDTDGNFSASHGLL